MQCEGWIRRGGAFTLGPVSWEQCKSDGIVILKIRQKIDKPKIQSLPACQECWTKVKDNKSDNGAKIISVEPLPT